MTAQQHFDPAPVGAAERFSTRIAFFIAGLCMSAWAPLVPLAKARAQLDEGTLGILLLGLGAGSILTMPLAGHLSSLRGCRWVMLLGSLGACLSLPMLASFSSAAGLAAAVLLFGAAMGLLDCAMNIQAVLVEQASDRPLMSGFHGLFSVGGIVGAAGMTGLLSLGLGALPAVLGVVALTVALLLMAGRYFLPYGSAREGPPFAVPHGVVLFLGVLCFIVFMTEGAMLDWSAVFLVGNRAMEPAWAGLGYAAFAATMTAGRLTGDAMVSRLGGPTLVVLGGLLAALGLAISLVPLGWPVALVGYALVGAGCSNIVPVLFTAVGRQTRMPQRTAIPAMISLGYAGILLGPAAIGLAAHLTTLAWALGGLIALLLFVAASGRYLRN
ncbi:MFS transporter [Pseudomonas typographi]|uniref:MFS transporter n=1 Tax=Pseudomonas typographi TaxID=2715964 RepID=UPI0016896684|nr:MFS transporter [Pseudomonas typographi]MBD1587036.1 MFS transporter [Pseudomonas typographi]